MTNGVFKPLGYTAYARATNVMSTESATDFEWSVKLVGTSVMYVGIASQLKPEMTAIFEIFEYDQNSILLNNFTTSKIKIGSNTINSSLTKYKTGDVIRFRFQPRAKKLVVDLVSNGKSPIYLILLTFKNGPYEINLKDNVNYFPVVQTGFSADTEVHLIDH